MPAKQMHQNSMNALNEAPASIVNPAPRRLATPTIGTRLHAVGEPAQRDRAERVEEARRGADEDDGALR